MFYIDVNNTNYASKQTYWLMAFVFLLLVKGNLLFIRYIHCNTQFAQLSKWLCFKLTRILPCRLFDERRIYCVNVLNSWFDHNNWLFTDFQNNNDISCAKCNFRPIKVITFHGSNYPISSKYLPDVSSQPIIRYWNGKFSKDRFSVWSDHMLKNVWNLMKLLSQNVKVWTCSRQNVSAKMCAKIWNNLQIHVFMLHADNLRAS